MLTQCAKYLDASVNPKNGNSKTATAHIAAKMLTTKPLRALTCAVFALASVLGAQNTADADWYKKNPANLTQLTPWYTPR